MQDSVTEQVAAYVRRKGIKIATISYVTGISYGILRRCLVRRDRSLRAEEFMIICRFLSENPNKFVPYSFVDLAGEIQEDHPPASE